jgi:hypothetical protein
MAKMYASNNMDHEIDFLTTELQSEEFTSWSKYWEVSCRLFSAFIHRYSGYEINRKSLAIVTREFKTQMKISIKAMVEGQGGTQALKNKGQSSQSIPLNQKIVPLLFYSPEHSPNSSGNISRSQETTGIFSMQNKTTSLNTSGLHSINQKSTQILENDQVTTPLLIYVRKFMQKTKIKWQCAHDFSLYVVEVGLL